MNVSLIQQVEEIRAALNKGYEVRAKVVGRWYPVHDAYGLKGKLRTVVSFSVSPSWFKLLPVKKKVSLSNKTQESIIRKNYEAGITIIVGGFSTRAFTVVGIDTSSRLFQVVVRDSITPEKYIIIKCKEHAPCMNGHCHEPGCEFHEDACEDQLKEWSEQQQLELAAERANEEALYNYEMPRW